MMDDLVDEVTDLVDDLSAPHRMTQAQALAFYEALAAHFDAQIDAIRDDIARAVGG